MITVSRKAVGMTMTALIIITVIISIFAAVSFIPIDAEFSASYEEKNGNVSLCVKYLFIRLDLLPAKKGEEKKEKKAPHNAEEKKKKKKDKQYKQKKMTLPQTITFAKEILLSTWDDITGLIDHFFSHTLEMKKFFIEAKIGTGDPMYTGIAYGAASALIYNILSLADRHTKLSEWDAAISADYDRFILEGRTDMIIRTRIAYVLKIGSMAAFLCIKILLLNKKLRKQA